jgi:hypothetical protein
MRDFQMPNDSLHLDLNLTVKNKAFSILVIEHKFQVGHQIACVQKAISLD